MMVGSTTVAGGRGGLQPENGVAARTTSVTFQTGDRQLRNLPDPFMGARVRSAALIVNERTLRTSALRTGWYRIPDAQDFRVMRANLGRLSTF
jgi:hypothetical protein